MTGEAGAVAREPPDVEVDVAVAWKGEPLLRRRVREGDTAWVGDVEGSWVRIPCEPIGVEGFRLAHVKQGEAKVFAPRGARGRLERPDGTVELFGAGREVWLLPGDLVQMRIGSFSIAVTGVAVKGAGAAAATRRVRGWVRRFPGGQLGLSAVFHVALLVVALVWPAGEPPTAAQQAETLTEAEVAAILGAASEGPGGPAAPGAAMEPAAAAQAAGAEEPGDLVRVGSEDTESKVAPEQAEALAAKESAAGTAAPGQAAKEAAGQAAKEAPGRAATEAPGRAATQGGPEASRAEAGTRGGSAAWGWLMGGALAVGGFGALRWRRSRARARGGRWTWAGALELGRRVTGGERVGVLGVERTELGGMAGSEDGERDVERLVVAEGASELGWGSLDVVGLSGEAASRDVELERAWRSVRAGGVLVVGAASDSGEGLLVERVRSATGAAVVWWFERGAGEGGGLRAVVMAVKGRPPRGPKEALAKGSAGEPASADALAITAGFRGWAPLRDAGDLEVEEGRLAG